MVGTFVLLIPIQKDLLKAGQTDMKPQKKLSLN